jgi:outer membrane murein-binding lipoprotein Lpp
VTPADAAEWLRFWSSLTGAALVLAGVVYTARKGRQSTRQASEASMVAPLLARITDLEKRVEQMWDKLEASALTKRAAGDHIDVLEQHIWQRKPPPPPVRPPGV